DAVLHLLRLGRDGGEPEDRSQPAAAFLRRRNAAAAGAACVGRPGMGAPAGAPAARGAVQHAGAAGRRLLLAARDPVLTMRGPCVDPVPDVTTGPGAVPECHEETA